MKIVPADRTIAELEKKAVAADAEASKQADIEAAGARHFAELCREWMRLLKNSRWMSFRNFH